MMERRNHSNCPGACTCSRTWKDTALDAMLVITYMLLGFTLGIALCKFCPEFWRWIN